MEQKALSPKVEARKKRQKQLLSPIAAQQAAIRNEQQLKGGLNSDLA